MRMLLRIAADTSGLTLRIHSHFCIIRRGLRLNIRTALAVVIQGIVSAGIVHVYIVVIRSARNQLNLAIAVIIDIVRRFGIILLRHNDRADVSTGTAFVFYGFQERILAALGISKNIVIEPIGRIGKVIVNRIRGIFLCERGRLNRLRAVRRINKLHAAINFHLGIGGRFDFLGGICGRIITDYAVRNHFVRRIITILDGYLEHFDLFKTGHVGNISGYGGSVRNGRCAFSNNAACGYVGRREPTGKGITALCRILRQR